MQGKCHPCCTIALPGPLQGMLAPPLSPACTLPSQSWPSESDRWPVLPTQPFPRPVFITVSKPEGPEGQRARLAPLPQRLPCGPPQSLAASRFVPRCPKSCPWRQSCSTCTQERKGIGQGGFDVRVGRGCKTGMYWTVAFGLSRENCS